MLRQLDDPRAEIAIEWMIEMSSGEMSESRARSFEAWLNADERNETAWIRLQEGLMPCGVAARAGLTDGALGQRLLKKQASRRKFLTGIVGLAGTGALALATADHMLPAGALSADHFTLTAQQKQVQLADGSRLTLAPRAAVAVRFTERERVLRLFDGEILVDVAEGRQPFRVDTGALNLRSDGGTFVLHHQPARLSVTGIKGRGSVDSRPVEQIAPGLDFIFAGDRIERGTADPDVATAWTDGMLLAKDKALGTIIDELRPYFHGVIRLDPAIADMRATAVLRLADTNGSIDVLATSLNLKVRRFSHYWVSVGPAAA
ncbi:FecR family protein [Rhizobium sp. Leaf341]|uniref:FecR family protein n=1 Tax=Rhizobium sp. Leaf341 TaxID=1736344 RepID=UPI0007148EF9|nr:FecR domain-containing protein [Rhizobium sp. Leaf341]KQR69958.1 hypothetical protein ASG03_04675 [Rhizobium sp. Leaf341]